MIPYSFNQILFFFYVYCFIGWIIESTWVSSHQKKFVNRGFMRGPFIPIYGFGAITLLLSSITILQWPVAVFFSGMFAASVLEYFTGAAMEAIFKVRYWDYSKNKFNLNGHICLFTSLCWGFLSLVMNYFLHKPIETLCFSMGDTLVNYVTGAITIYFIVDLTLSFKAAFDLRDLIIAMDKAKEELRIMQKRLDVMIAYANEGASEQLDKVQDKISSITESVGDKVDVIGVRLEDLSASVEEKMRTLKTAMEEKPLAYAEGIRTEYHELVARFKIKSEEHYGLSKFTDFYRRGIFLGNPDIVSTKFRENVESVKKFVTEKRNRQD